MNKNLLDMQNLREELPFFSGPAQAQSQYKKTYKDCKEFVFTPHSAKDVLKILQYFLDAKKENLQAKMPEDLLQKAN